MKKEEHPVPHQSCTQTFVKTLNALGLEEHPRNLCGRYSSGRCNYCSRVVGATQHGIGDHKLCGWHLDWLLLLRSYDQTNNYYSYSVKATVICIYYTKNGKFSPSLPASCSWIFSISIGVVITTWHMPAPHPANISLNTVRLFLLTDRCIRQKQDNGLVFVFFWFLFFFLMWQLFVPIFCKLMSEKVICCQLDCLLRGDQGQIYSCTCREKR